MEQKAVTWEGAVPAITWQDSTANNYNPDHRYALLTPLPPTFSEREDDTHPGCTKNFYKKILKKEHKGKIEKQMQYPSTVT